MEIIRDRLNARQLRKAEQGPCKELVSDRKLCQQDFGRESPLCTQKKLREKRCLADQLCPGEFLGFYGGKPSCASLVERFCTATSEDEPNPHEVASKTPKRCRAATHALGHCLHKFLKTRKEDPAV